MPAFLATPTEDKSRFNWSGAEAGRSDGEKLSVRRGVDTTVRKSRQLSN